MGKATLRQLPLPAYKTARTSRSIKLKREIDIYRERVKLHGCASWCFATRMNQDWVCTRIYNFASARLPESASMLRRWAAPPPPPPPPPNDWRMKLVNFIIFHGVARCLRTLLLHLVHYLASPRRVRSWWKLSINEKIYPNRWNPFILTLEICKLFVTFVNLFTLNFIQFNSLDLHFTDKGSSRDKEYVAESLETVIGLFVIGIKG